MKTCTKCSESRPEEEFPFRNRDRGTRNSWCKSCMNTRSAEKYLANRIFLAKYLASHPCVDCGESDPLVLEFDHVQLRGSGDRTVGSLTNVSKNRMLEEIAKCEVRCANCHTRRTRIQMGWSNYHLLSGTDVNG